MNAYTLHSQGSYGLANLGNASGFTFGVQFSVSETVTLTGIWYYSSPPATTLPSACCLYNANTEAQISGTLNNSPSWSGAAGSGWVKCSYSSPSLSSGINYIAVVFDTGGNDWWSGVSGYWTSGAGSGGITNGPLSAPASTGAVNGQAPFVANGAALEYPDESNSGYDWGVDVEVTPPAPAASPGLLIAGII